MPPKAKFTQDHVITCALSIVENEGIEHLTARNLGKRLGSSARPIFTVFENMDDVLLQLRQRAEDIYASYVNKGLTENPPFKGVGMSYIRFATEHPKLFQLLFMKEQQQVPDVDNVLLGIENSYDAILSSICSSYDLDANTAKTLYLHIWIYTHGIAVLIATKTCSFSAEEASKMLTTAFTSLLVRAKKGELQ